MTSDQQTYDTDTLSSKSDPNPPTWYLEPKNQIERLKELNSKKKWGFANSEFPEHVPKPVLFESEILLLAPYLHPANGINGIQRNYDEHIDTLVEQFGPFNFPYVSKGLALTSAYCPGVRWVILNYGAHRKNLVSSLWGDRKISKCLASSEILSALILFPDLVFSLNGRDTPFMNLPGYQICCNNKKEAMYVTWWPNLERLELATTTPDKPEDGRWSSPLIREVS